MKRPARTAGQTQPTNLRCSVKSITGFSGRSSYAMVLRTLEYDNAKLDQRDRVTIDSIRHHTKRHFPVQNVAQATYRAILERRAQENGVDFVKGVATAITPMAFFETVMVKGYETLVDPGTRVDVGTGMMAAGRLQALNESRASGTRIADLRAQMGRIIDAIHDTVPEELWPEILRKIDGPVAADRPADELEDGDDADDEYDAPESAQRRTAGLRVHGEPAEMSVKADRIIATARSAVLPETAPTAQAERRGRSQPSCWRKRAGTASIQTMILSTPTPTPTPMTSARAAPRPSPYRATSPTRRASRSWSPAPRPSSGRWRSWSTTPTESFQRAGGINTSAALSRRRCPRTTRSPPCVAVGARIRR